MTKLIFNKSFKCSAFSIVGSIIEDVSPSQSLCILIYDKSKLGANNSSPLVFKICFSLYRGLLVPPLFRHLLPINIPI